MTLPALLAALASVGSQFASPMVVQEPTRLALTPHLDGKLDTEEWELLSDSGGMTSYFQWEPGKVHVAGKVPLGSDALISLDLGGDGWLLGQNNLEVRVGLRDGALEITERILNGTAAEGPVWEDATSYRAATSAKGEPGEDQWTFEMTIDDPGTGLMPKKPGDTVRIRCDAVESGTPNADAFLPRDTTALNLAMDRASNLPEGVKWGTEYRGRSVVPGGHMRIRVTFNREGEIALTRADMRTEGLAASTTRSAGVPFPAFDRKGRAFIDYDTDVASNSVEGYRIMRTTVETAGGQQSILQTSYQIAPYVVFDFVRPGNLRTSDDPKTERFSVWIRSNSMKRVTGVFSVAVPEGFNVEDGNNKTFVIINARGSKRQVFSMQIPGGFKGTVPIELRADYPGSSYTQTVWLTIP